MFNVPVDTKQAVIAIDKEIENIARTKDVKMTRWISAANEFWDLEAERRSLQESFEHALHLKAGKLEQLTSADFTVPAQATVRQLAEANKFVTAVMVALGQEIWAIAGLRKQLGGLYRRRSALASALRDTSEARDKRIASQLKCIVSCINQAIHDQQWMRERLPIEQQRAELRAVVRDADLLVKAARKQMDFTIE